MPKYINQIYNTHKVTPKCESEARTVSHQMQLTFQFLESQEEIMKTVESLGYAERVEVYSVIWGREYGMLENQYCSAS